MPTYRLEEGSVQWQFHNSRQKIQIFGGGYGNGKTTAMAVKALNICKLYPGCNGLLARSTYPKLNDTLRAVFLTWCPPNWIKRRPTQEDNTVYLHNGSVVNFRYIAQRGKKTESGDTTSNLLSATYDFIGVDQIEDPEITHKDLLDLMGRLRGHTPYKPLEGEDDPSMPSSGPRWLMLAANPSQGWFYREIVKPYHLWKQTGHVSERLLVDPDTQLPVIDLFEGSTYTNKANLDRDYMMLLEASYKGQQKARYLEGKWEAFEGLVHPSYDRVTHTLPRDFAITYLQDCLRRHVKVQPIEMYDFGLTSPSVYMMGFVDDYGRVIIIDGYYQGDFSYEDQPIAIKEIRMRYIGMLEFGKEPIIADPAIFKKNVVSGRKTGESVAKLLSDGTGLSFKPGNNDIPSGIAKVNAYLGGHPKIPHLVTGAYPGPLLYFVDDMQFVEDEISSYYWKKHTATGQNTDEPQDHNDHAMNAIKYGLSFRPEPSQIILPSSERPKAWMFWHEEPDAA
jgi:hypothetical protein